MVRKDEINSLIESKFDELKNAFVNETKELFIKEMKDEMKKLFAENLKKSNRNQQKDGRVKVNFIDASEAC